jgi:uncharacterized protein (UPF0261 family)
MRATAEESGRIGRFIADKLNRCAGPVRFFLPEGGLSGLDVDGGVFRDPVADDALFAAIADEFVPTEARRLVRSPPAINDAAFADQLVDAFCEIAGGG